MPGFRVWGLFWENIWLFFCGSVWAGDGGVPASVLHMRGFHNRIYQGVMRVQQIKVLVMAFYEGILREFCRVLS